MEGYNAGGIRKVLGIPRRFSIPLIVSTGVPYKREVEEEGEDDVGMGHGSPLLQSDNASSRFPVTDVIFGDSFGGTVSDLPWWS